MLEDDELKQRMMAARAWLSGTLGTRNIPHLTYFERDSVEDRAGRLAIAQLLMDNNAPRDIRQLLAAVLVPDCDVVPTSGYPIHPTGAPSTELSQGPLPRRLDFVSRGKGKRKRGTTKLTDPHKAGYIISAVAVKLQNGMKKTPAFQQVADELKVSESTVRTYWKHWADARGINWDRTGQ